MTFILDARLTLVLLGTLPFIAAAVFGISRRGVTLYTGLQEAVDGLTAVIRENSAGVRVIKALNRSDYEKERFDRANKEAVSWEKRAGAVMALTNPLITLFLNAGLCAVILLGAYLVFRGQSTAGKIIAFISYFTLISNALISISRIFTSLSKGSAGMKRINRVLQTEPETYVKACPGAEDYRLDSKGVNLSGGQRQRLLIARALAARPPFLILDDAASALDYKTDAALRKAIRQNLQDTTTLIIAQRISAIRHADLILVLEEGRIIGRGTHEELLESCGVYREIAESQMGGGDLLD